MSDKTKCECCGAACVTPAGVDAQPTYACGSMLTPTFGTRRSQYCYELERKLRDRKTVRKISDEEILNNIEEYTKKARIADDLAKLLKCNVKEVPEKMRGLVDRTERLEAEIKEINGS